MTTKISADNLKADIAITTTGDIDVSSGTLTLANDQISGDIIHGGTISTFTSTGIDDNATSTAITINSSEQVSFTDGTASLPSITNLGDENTGMFFPDANEIGFALAGSEKVRIKGGDVFIGANSIALSTSQIQILFGGVGNLLSGLGVGDSTELRSNSYYSSTNQHKYLVSDEASRYKQANGTHGFDIAPTGTAGDVVSWTRALTINNSGNVGIGTTAPDAKLSVNGVASFGDGTALLPSIANFGDLNTGMWFPAADTIAFSEGGVEAMRITSAGNVGIGTSSPNSFAKLHIVDGAGTLPTMATGDVLTIQNNNDTSDNAGLTAISGTSGLSYVQFGDSADKNEGAVYYSNSDDSMRFVANASERMRINSSGNVGIGTSSPIHELVLSKQAGGITDNPTFQIINRYPNEGNNIGYSNRALTLLEAGNGTVRTRIQSRFDSGANLGEIGTETSHDFRLLSAGAERMRIDSSGNVGVGTSSPSQKLDVVGSIEVSDGIYIGGTGTANKLDDYEEGTWTPVITAQTGTITSYTSAGKYTKIGDLVYVWIYYDISNVGSGTDNCFISSFPFTAKTTAYSVPFTGVGRNSSNNTGVIQISGNATAGLVALYNGGISNNIMASAMSWRFSLAYLAS